MQHGNWEAELEINLRYHLVTATGKWWSNLFEETTFYVYNVKGS